MRGRAEELPIADRLYSAILSHVRFFGEDPDGMALFLNEFSNLKQRNRAEVRRIMRDYEEVYRSLIQEGMKAGIFRSEVAGQVGRRDRGGAPSSRATIGPMSQDSS